MDKNEWAVKRISGPQLWTVKDRLDIDEAYTFIIALIDQNSELSSRVEYLDSLIKLLAKNIIETRKQAERIASEILKEANKRASGIILEAEHRAKLEIDRMKAEAENRVEADRQEAINAAIEKGRAIVQETIDKAKIIRAEAEAQAREVIDEANTEEDIAFSERIEILAQWILESNHLVVFTGAGISTESGLPDFRGPDGIWTREKLGLPPPETIDWSDAQPNIAHKAIVELQNMGKIKYLISQNVDNLHLKSGIHPDLLAELHGNIYKVRCRNCGFKCYAIPDSNKCPLCGGKLVSTLVNFGGSIPKKEWRDSEWHSRHCDLFIVVGSSLNVFAAAKLPRIAVDSGAKLVIINHEKTYLDPFCHLRFTEIISKVLPLAVERFKELVKKYGELPTGDKRLNASKV